jgi:hypothetical protein
VVFTVVCACTCAPAVAQGELPASPILQTTQVELISSSHGSGQWQGAGGGMRQFSPRVLIDSSGERHGRALPSIEKYILDPAKVVSRAVPDTKLGERAVLHFNVIAGISKVTADHYGGFESAKLLILNQITTVNIRFNDPNVFANTYQFTVDSIYQFDGNPLSEILLAHPGYDYRVTYDGYPTQGGGWYGPPWSAIHHSWPVNEWGGTFAAYATDAIVHEFGHARGAIDLYAIQVSAPNNPVNGQPYAAEYSIMNYPYGVQVWDEHTVNLINRTADTVISSSVYIDESFPAGISIAVRDSTGSSPLQGALVNLYPVNWYSNTLSASYAFSGSTTSDGIFQPSSNPFGPFVSGHPWEMEYPNFLVSCQLNAVSVYGWLPITSVQNSYFANNDTTFQLVLKMPFGCCSGTTGNVNRSAAEPPDLSDLSLLIAYLTVTPRPVLPCAQEANVNAADLIDLSDLSLLISYLTMTPKPVLPNCQ